MRSRLKRKERKKKEQKAAGSTLTRSVPALQGTVFREVGEPATTLRGTDQYLRITCFAFVGAGREQPFAPSQRPAAQEMCGSTCTALEDTNAKTQY
jgi:hypothetical protein